MPNLVLVWQFERLFHLSAPLIVGLHAVWAFCGYNKFLYPARPDVTATTRPDPRVTGQVGWHVCCESRCAAEHNAQRAGERRRAGVVRRDQGDADSSPAPDDRQSGVPRRVRVQRRLLCNVRRVASRRRQDALHELSAGRLPRRAALHRRHAARTRTPHLLQRVSEFTSVRCESNAAKTTYKSIRRYHTSPRFGTAPWWVTLLICCDVTSVLPLVSNSQLTNHLRRSHHKAHYGKMRLFTKRK